MRATTDASTNKKIVNNKVVGHSISAKRPKPKPSQPWFPLWEKRSFFLDETTAYSCFPTSSELQSPFCPHWIFFPGYAEQKEPMLLEIPWLSLFGLSHRSCTDSIYDSKTSKLRNLVHSWKSRLIRGKKTKIRPKEP